MLALKQYRDRAKGVVDLLNWAALIDDGIVLGKDGSVLAGWFFRGPDVASMTASERNYLSTRINAALTRLGGEWALWFDAVRLPAASYPDTSRCFFPDPISRMIDEERRAQFLAEGAHYETEHALILSYTPPLERRSRIIDLIYDDDDPGASQASPSERQLGHFKRTLDEIEDALADLLQLQRMSGFTVEDTDGSSHLRDELVNYLQFCLTGELAGLTIPPCPMYLDAVIGGQELWAGDTPRIGDRFICCLAIEGFPHESYPLILSVLDDVAVAYRFSTRFLPLELHDALGELHRYRRKWTQKKRGFLAQIFRTKGGYVNEDAALMEHQAERALSDANSALVSHGYYTPVIVLMGTSRADLAEQARTIARAIRGLGFASRVETVNTMEAWLGSLPGHRHPNVRRPLIHSLNLADLGPWTAKWPGLPANPSPMFPPNTPPLMHAATTGATPYRLNLHVGDVGHTLIFGPTGAGKSVLLAMLVAQFLRYPRAQIFVFDKGRSIYAMAKACGGAHYDLASDERSPGLCPLAVLDSDADLAWAEDWLASCYALQTGERPTPAQRNEIYRALSLMRRAQGGGRTLTDFLATVQDAGIRAALRPYTLEGALGSLLDSRQDDIAPSHFTVFELDELMGLGEDKVLPVLAYLFRRIERAMDGRPTLLLLDEAWQMLSHPVFAEKLREWLKTWRKANGAVVMATQSVSDAVRSKFLDVLIESCPTKILLPNEEAGQSGTTDLPGPREIYAMLGLNDAEIAILQTARKKRDYYVISPEGRRLIELGLGPVALAFAAASSREDLAAIRELEAAHGDRWPSVWLQQKGISHEPVA
jgi:type IV secretion/conjugal transfer VirB4 family ATPase